MQAMIIYAKSNSKQICAHYKNIFFTFYPWVMCYNDTKYIYNL